jgi:hypothetical protein
MRNATLSDQETRNCTNYKVKTPTDAAAKSSINSLHSGQARTRSDNTCQFWGVRLPILANKIPFMLKQQTHQICVFCRRRIIIYITKQKQERSAAIRNTFSCKTVSELSYRVSHSSRMEIFPHGTTPIGRRPPHYRLHDHTQTHHTRQDSPGQVISPTQKSQTDNKKHS